MVEFLDRLGEVLTVWSSTRAAGLTAYVLFFISVAVGMYQSFPNVSLENKLILRSVHQWAGWLGLWFGSFHGIVLLFDQEVHFSLKEIFVPFASNTDTILVSLGIISFYIILIIMVSSDLIKIVGKRLWKSIHFLSIPGFFFALLHGVLMGTDSQSSWILGLYLITGAIVGGLFIIRTSKSMGKTSENPMSL